MMEGWLFVFNLGEIGGMWNYFQFLGICIDDIFFVIVRNVVMKKIFCLEMFNMDCVYIDNIMMIDLVFDFSMFWIFYFL